VYLCPSMGQVHDENGWFAGKWTGTKSFHCSLWLSILMR
jgi:hypothetical protein